MTLLELLQQHTALTKVGKHWRGLCPFHQEKTPSFHVAGERFHCFGCGASGDMAAFEWRLTIAK